LRSAASSFFLRRFAILSSDRRFFSTSLNRLANVFRCFAIARLLNHGIRA
jgi:hypothetical protein